LKHRRTCEQRKGATATDLTRLEERLGASLPEDFKESWATHDSQKSEADLIPVGFGTYFFLSKELHL
jgi:cell wall assembly regulator SMI1